MIDSVRFEWARFRALRRLRRAEPRLEEDPAVGARVVCVASGKGGTGKSIVATNLACARAAAGERVLLVDFDAGLANDHLLLGLAPRHDLGHVMQGEVRAEEALVQGPAGLRLLSGGVGRHALTSPTRRELDRLFKALLPLESQFDLVVIDHGAGLGYAAVAHFAATSTLILVTNPEVTALSDAYAVYKRATMVNAQIRAGLVINKAVDREAAAGAWSRFRAASQRFLGHAPELIGWVPLDPAIARSVGERRPVSLGEAATAGSLALGEVAKWGPIDYARTSRTFYESARRALR